ncbi:hypothetical protein FRX31_009998 [Thalictrum thalictroides]|uniref:Uncharacterized protein n=1 Tax=Thalictrum thalictroides TaxID=46969 RepID=A0A7J6WV98_THATH|nr:hypothetical protein FRX31_009998 [Thalictrum thalictroides]
MAKRVQLLVLSSPLLLSHKHSFSSFSNQRLQVLYKQEMHTSLSRMYLHYKNHGGSIGIKCEAFVDKDDGFYMRRCVDCGDCKEGNWVHKS